MIDIDILIEKVEQKFVIAEDELKFTSKAETIKNVDLQSALKLVDDNYRVFININGELVPLKSIKKSRIADIIILDI